MSRSPKRPTLGDTHGALLEGLLQRMGQAGKLPKSTSTIVAPIIEKPIAAAPGKQSRELTPTRLVSSRSATPLPPFNAAKNRQPITTVSRQPASSFTPSTPPPVKPKPPEHEWPDERRRKAAIRVRATVAAAFPSPDEERPSNVSDATRLQIAEAVTRGAEIWATDPMPDLDNGFIVGLDFGTSAVKLAVRQPYISGDPVRALETPADLQSRAQPHPYLWPTVVWFNPADGRFQLVPSEGAIALDGFKSGLIAGKGKEPANPLVAVSRAEACVAFLALQLTYFLGRYAIVRPLGEVGGEHFLSINIGVPVHSMAQRDVVSAFARVVAAAVSACPMTPYLTLADVHHAHTVAQPVLPPGFELVPELTAAIAGYVAEPTARSGQHMLVDVGAATLDIVAFNLLRRGEQVSVFAGEVEMFGAASMGWATAAGVSAPTFKDACDHQFDTVFSKARDQDPIGFDPRYRKNVVSLIKTGGGCATTLHEKFIAEMVGPNVLGASTIESPEPPASITSRKSDRGRLLLAYGLTRDVTELAHCRLPDEISAWTAVSRRAPMGAVSKDQV